MTAEQITVRNRAGLHARPASLIVKTAQKYESSIFLEKEGMKVNAKSIMNIFSLGAAYKTELIISAEGPDEQEAVNALAALFNSRFEEVD